MDPLSVIRELSDLLAVSRGRVVFVNGGSGTAIEPDEDEEVIQGLRGAMRMIGAARAEAARLLREELGEVGIDVCEVVVGECFTGQDDLSTDEAGPMASKGDRSINSSRQSSDDSMSSNSSRKRILAGALAK
jgi:hypothetical protein